MGCGASTRTLPDTTAVLAGSTTAASTQQTTDKAAKENSALKSAATKQPTTFDLVQLFQGRHDAAVAGVRMQKCNVFDEAGELRFEIAMQEARVAKIPSGHGMPLDGGNVYHMLMLYRCGPGEADACDEEASMTLYGPHEVPGKTLVYRVPKLEVTGNSSAGSAAFRLDVFWYRDGTETPPSALGPSGLRYMNTLGEAPMRFHFRSADETAAEAAVALARQHEGKFVCGARRLAVFLIGGGLKRRVPDETTLLSLGLSLADVPRVDATSLAKVPDGDPLPAATVPFDCDAFALTLPLVRNAVALVLLADAGRFREAERRVGCPNVLLSVANEWLSALHEHGPIVEVMSCEMGEEEGCVLLALVRSRSRGANASEKHAAPVRTGATLRLQVDAGNKITMVGGCDASCWLASVATAGGFGMAVLPRAATLSAFGVETDAFQLLCSEKKALRFDFKLEWRKTQWVPKGKQVIVVVPRRKTADARVARVASESCTLEGGGVDIDDSFETFAVGRIDASKLGDLRVAHTVWHRSCCVATAADPPFYPLEDSIPFASKAGLTPEERSDYLCLSARDREMICEALDWFGISVDASHASGESPIDFVNRVARLMARVGSYSWPRDSWPMGPSGIFEAATGHCGTYNLAMTYACRARGVPARCVTGAIGQPVGMDFHITSEAWVDGMGWLPADCTVGGLHLDDSFSGWNAVTPAAGVPGCWVGWHTMSASAEDVSESRRLLGNAWSGGAAEGRTKFFESQFDSFDANGDGALSPAELLAALDTLQAGHPAYNRAMQDAGTATAHTLARMWDSDGDGKVSRREFVSAMASLERSVSGKSEQGYAGEMNGRTSAGYGFFGVNLYHAKSGQPIGMEVCTSPPPPPPPPTTTTSGTPHQ